MNSEQGQDTTTFAAVDPAKLIAENCLHVDIATGSVLFDEEMASRIIFDYAQDYTREAAMRYLGMVETYKHVVNRWQAISDALDAQFPGEKFPDEDSIKMTLRLFRWIKDARASLAEWGTITEFLSTSPDLRNDIVLGQRAQPVAIRLIKELIEARQRLTSKGV